MRMEYKVKSRILAHSLHVARQKMNGHPNCGDSRVLSNIKGTVFIKNVENEARAISSVTCISLSTWRALNYLFAQRTESRHERAAYESAAKVRVCRGQLMSILT